MVAATSDSGTKVCRRCGEPLAGAELSGNCPRCLTALLLSPDTPEPGETSPAPILRRLGDYELLEEVARGGMGVVFRARQSSLGREVAVKVLRDAWLATPIQVKRFRAEAANAAKLKHPNIVPVHEVGEQSGQHYFAMDLIKGTNLAELTRDGPLPPRRGAELVEKVAEAVQHAHQEGVLHRDLKPSNVLLDAQGEPQVTDFGLARPMDDDSSLTLTGQVLGTPGYIAPEQAKGGGTVGPAADVYGLGALLFHLLTGRAPFVGASAAETLTQVLQQEPLSPRLLNPAVPMDLAAVCGKCLAKLAGQRYASARELAEDLRRFLDGQATRARPAGVVERGVRWCRRKPALAGTLASALLLLIVVAVGAPIAAYRINRERSTARQLLYAADMRVVQQAIEEGDLGRARELLAYHVPTAAATDLRGFEWRYFSHRARGDQLATIESDVRNVRHLAVSSDGHFVAAGRRVWNASSQKLVLDQSLDEGDRALAFLPHSYVLLIAARDGLKRRDLLTGDGGMLLPGETNVSAFAFSKSGQWLAIGSDSGPTQGLKVYDARAWTLTGCNTSLWFDPLFGAKALAFSPDESVLVTAAGDARTDASELQCWEVPLLKALPFPTNTVKNAACISFSPDGGQLFTGSWDGVVRVWDAKTRTELPNRRSVQHHRSWIADMAFLPGSHQLVTAGSDRCVRLWGTELAERPVTLRGHTAELRAMALTTNGEIFSVSEDGTINEWSARSAHQGEWLSQKEPRLVPVGLSADGQVAVTLAEGALKFWDVSQREFSEMIPRRWEANQFKELQVDSDRAEETLTISPDLKWLVVVRLDQPTQLWNVGERTLRVLPSIGGWRVFAVFSPDSQILAAPISADAVALWNPTTGRQLASIPWPVPSEATVSFAAVAHILALGGRTNVLLWDLRTQQRLSQFAIQGDRSIALSPDAKLLATGSRDQKVRLYDCQTGQKFSAPLLGHLSGVERVSFAPDGRTLVSASRQWVKLWNLATRREVASYQQPARVLLTTFSTDGSTLLTSDGAGHYIQIWRAPALPGTEHLSHP
ncbi:MAG: protein kinase [Verrucomicrobia bacterium]|nr:protein kinase [Verrucomicrobiota bacterium]